MANNIVLVKFIADRLPYATGQTAGFPPEKAAQLVRDGLANYCDKDGRDIFEYAEEVVASSVSEDKEEAEKEEKKEEEKKEEAKSPNMPRYGMSGRQNK